MHSRYRIGDIMKNVAISKDSGITYVYRDEVNGKPESYGFETEKGGMAYKGMEDILSNISDTADVYDIIMPIYNFKAGAEEE